MVTSRNLATYLIFNHYLYFVHILVLSSGGDALGKIGRGD